MCVCARFFVGGCLNCLHTSSHPSQLRIQYTKETVCKFLALCKRTAFFIVYNDANKWRKESVHTIAIDSQQSDVVLNQKRKPNRNQEKKFTNKYIFFFFFFTLPYWLNHAYILNGSL